MADEQPKRPIDLYIDVDHKDRQLYERLSAALTGSTSTPADRKKAEKEVLHFYRTLTAYVAFKGDLTKAPDVEAPGRQLWRTREFQELELVIKQLCESPASFDPRQVDDEENNPVTQLKIRLQRAREVMYRGDLEDLYRGPLDAEKIKEIQAKPLTPEEIQKTLEGAQKQKSRQRGLKEIAESYLPKKKEGEE